MPIIFILLWSSGYLFAAKGIEVNQPATFITLRLLLCCFIVGIILVYQRKTILIPWKQISWRKTIQMGITGILLQGFYQLFIFTAVYEGISPGILSIILGTQPIITTLITRPSLRAVQVTGLIVGLLGLALTVSHALYISENTTTGITCCFLALFGITTGTILQKKYGSNTSLTLSLFIQYLASFIFIFIIYLLQGMPAIQWHQSFIISLAWMVLIISIASTYLFYYLLKKHIIVNFTSYLYCVPIVTALMDFLFFGRTLSPTSIIGMLTIICGLMLTLKSKQLQNSELS